ncbi:hypothetical protein TcasGA2_TC000628 [Tribolium castaneum]|uniref:Uncharacterized protein n=1 Tax=Tribolium castaneum TaxID=7070 RepID=D6W991_TRICA|nr:hypothetical protein TcasGA2_TC000628 [Tribolium castaneum]
MTADTAFIHKHNCNTASAMDDGSISDETFHQSTRVRALGARRNDKERRFEGA